VLTLIDCMFHFIKERVVFYKQNGVLLLCEKLSHEQPIKPISFVFHFMNAYNVVPHGVVVHLTEHAYALVDLGDGAADDIEEKSDIFLQSVDLIEKQEFGDMVNQIQDVVHAFGQTVNVFPVERSNKGLVQFLENSVSYFVTDVFEALDLVTHCN